MDLCLHWILLLRLRNIVDLRRPRSSGLKVLSFLLSLFVYIIGIQICIHIYLLLWKSQLLALKACVNPGWVILTIGSFFGLFIDNNLKQMLWSGFIYSTFWIWYHVNSRHPPEQWRISHHFLKCFGRLVAISCQMSFFAVTWSVACWQALFFKNPHRKKSGNRENQSKSPFFEIRQPRYKESNKAIVTWAVWAVVAFC